MVDSLLPLGLAISPVILILAFSLDLAIGDPAWLPHPVRIIGAAVARLESLLRRQPRSPRSEKAGGVFLVILTVLPVFCIALLIQGMLTKLAAGHPSLALLSVIIMVYLTATTIAAKELADSARLVIAAVKQGDIKRARSNLSMIVGRDTKDLPEKGILKATIETLAENLSDGVIAPLFFLAIGGLPLAMAYKAVNTLDSMVGYRNDTYRHFGWAAARLDDAANYIPARITGLLIVIAVSLASAAKNARTMAPVARSAFMVMLRDGRKHLSPNSGIPEAAIAGGLGVMLGGPSTYGGVRVEKPYIGEEKPGSGPVSPDTGGHYLKASEQAVFITHITSLLGLSIALMLSYARAAL